MTRGRAPRTCCPAGHQYRNSDGALTEAAYIRPNGIPECRRCRQQRERKRTAEIRAERLAFEAAQFWHW